MNPPVELESHRLPGGACPNCSKILDAFSAVGYNLQGKPLLTGSYTLCVYCAAILIFMDEKGALRPVTPSERDAFVRHLNLPGEEVTRMLYDFVCQRSQQFDFTKMNCKDRRN